MQEHHMKFFPQWNEISDNHVLKCQYVKALHYYFHNYRRTIFLQEHIFQNHINVFDFYLVKSAKVKLKVFSLLSSHWKNV